MDFSPAYRKLLNAINDYIQESSKTTYRFSYEEEESLKYNIEFLKNHYKNLINYELKRQNKKDV